MNKHRIVVYLQSMFLIYKSHSHFFVAITFIAVVFVHFSMIATNMFLKLADVSCWNDKNKR